MEQKTETIKMLNFLIKQYETIPEINELHLIQLLLNIIPDINILYNIKFEQLEQKFNKNIEKLIYYQHRNLRQRTYISQKNNNIDFLNYLIEQYESNSVIKNISFTQLLLNAVQDKSKLYNINATELKYEIERKIKSLKSR